VDSKNEAAQKAERALISFKDVEEFESASPEGKIVKDFVLLLKRLEYTDNEIRDVVSSYIKNIRRKEK